MVVQTLQVLHLPINYPLCFLVFFSTLCSYNFHFLLGAIYLHKQLSANFLLQQKKRIIFFLTGAAGVALFLLPAQINIWLFFLAAFFTGLYSMPLLPVNMPAFVKNNGFAKTVLLAFTWMFVTAYLPMHQAGINIAAKLSIVLLFQRFVFMLILCLLFDCKDAATDKIIGFHSLATDVKPVYIKWCIYALFGLLFGINFLLQKNGLSLLDVVALSAITIICFFVYLFSLQKRGYVFYYFWVDGLMILSALLTGLAAIV